MRNPHFQIQSIFTPGFLLLFIFLSGCMQMNPSHKTEHGEDEMYDGPDKAAEFEFQRTKDPATGTVPRERYLTALQKTIESKNSLANSPSSITALTWVERGPNSDATGPSNGNTRANSGIASGRIRAIMVDSSDATHKTVWIGGVDGGLWKTTDITASPATWTVVNDNLSNLAIAAICQDPTNNQTMYFCTGESYFNVDAVPGNGVFKSTDGGANWSYLSNTSSYANATRILCDYQGNVYLATRGTGLLRSINGGTSWTNITPSTFPNSDICDLEISSTSAAGRLHVVCGIFSTQAYRYTDIPSTVSSGLGWTAPAAGFPSYTMRAEIACSGSTLYALPADNSYQVPTIYKSTNGGANWAATGAQPTSGWASGQGWYALAIDIDPSDPNNCIVGGLDTWKTTNGGTSWSQISTWVGTTPVNQYVHADVHKILWFDGGNKLLFGCDGGIHYSSDKGATIRDRNSGLRIKQFYSCAIHPSTTNYFLGGAQDNGVHQFSNAGLSSTVEVTGGDGAYVAIDQDEPLYQYGSYVFNQYRRSTDGGSTWSSVNLNASSGLFINPFDFDNSANIMYCSDAAGSYRRWTDPHTGSTSAVVSITALNSASVTAVSVSPYTANRVYFGTNGGRVVQVDAANTIASGSAGTNLSTGLPSGTIACINQGTNDNNLICCFTNYGINSVWVSTDGGTSWASLDNNGVNLPDMPVRWCMFYPNDNSKAYIATETGVWETSLINGTSTVWTANSTFPTVRTDMIKYRSSDRTIAAATHGRGLWTAIIPNVSTPDLQFENSSVSATESTTSVIGCRGYTDYTGKMQILNAPVGAATVTLSIAGGATATQNVDYAITTNGDFNSPSMVLNFADGITSPQSFTVRVYDDAAVESAESFTLNYAISGVTTAQAGSSNQTYTFTINDNDAAPTSSSTNTQTIGATSAGLGASLFNSALQSKRVQMLYKASELTATGLTAGSITSMSFYIGVKSSTRAFNNLAIKMGGTTNTTLVNGSVTPIGGLTTVKNAFTYSTNAGYNNFTFDNSYTWNGTDNIVIEVCYDNGTADGTQTADNTYGYSDCGGSCATGNMFWQDGINCSGSFSSVNYFSNDYKPQIKLTVSITGNAVSSTLNNTKSAYLGPNDDVYFYDASGNIMARIKNLTAFDYGCTQFTIDRAGSSSAQFWNNTAANYLLSKSVKVVPTNNTSSGSYQVTLYYTAAEIAGWQTATGRTWAGSTMQVAKVSNGYFVPNVTAAIPHSADVSVVTGTKGTFGSDYTIRGDFSSTGFSGFGVGVAGNAILTADFKTKSGGNFTDGTIWQYNNEGVGYVDAGQAPAPDNNATMQSGHTVALNAGATVNSGKTLTVSGTLNCGANIVSGAGTFTLAASATLGIGSTVGISSSGATGNIQTTTRNYSGSANYTYNGTANQATGNGLPSSINNLVINNTGAAANNIVSLDAGITVSGSTTLTAGLLSIGPNTLTVNGVVTGPGTLSGSAGSNFTIGGAAGTINFTTGAAVLKDFTLGAGATATLGTSLDITAGSTPGTVIVNSGATLTTGGNLTIKSDASGTARVGNSAGSISGAVTVERYIPANGNRAWRSLAVPTSGQTFHQAWQENQTAGATTPAGYGTQLTSSSATWSTDGYDFHSNSSGLLTYVPATGSNGSYATVSNTGNAIATTSGYFLYVRGDRTALPSNGTITATTLRSKGSLYQGNLSAITVPANQYALIGNPYASRIDLTQVTRGADIQDIYYVWDPLLTGNYGLGAFQTFTRSGASYVVTPGGGSYASGPYKTIESGQAFFVHSTGSTTNTVSFTEAAKTTGSGMVFKSTALGEQIVTNLYSLSGTSRNLADGSLNLYDNGWSNDVDNEDALKMGNFGLNLGTMRGDKKLVVEKRPLIGATDTIFFNLSGAARQQYQFEFIANALNHPGLLGKLVDSYLNTETPVNLDGTTTVDFRVTADPPSSSASRFMLVFYTAAPLPITSTSIKAWQTAGSGTPCTACGRGANIAVEWKVANQVNIQKYEVERSIDGMNFKGVATQPATGSSGSDAVYNWIDINPVIGDNFYRVRSIGVDGTVKYSSVVRVRISGIDALITVYPNPVKGKLINVQFTGMDQGKYMMRVMNAGGQVLLKQSFDISGSNANRSIPAGNMAKGNYYLEVVLPGKSKKVITFIIAE